MKKQKSTKIILSIAFITTLGRLPMFAADDASGFPDLSTIATRAQLDTLVSTLDDPADRKAIAGNADAILAAAKRHPHVEAVIRVIDSSPGMYRKINTTPEALEKAAGGPIALFDTLTQASTRIRHGKAHQHRNLDDDPYDAAFVEHLGHIPTLESVALVATKIEDSWMAPLLKLTRLKTLYIEGRGQLGDASLAQLQQLSEFPELSNLELAYFGKATDAGLELLAGLRNLERFTFRGSPIKGHAFAKFTGWSRLKSLNFHSNNLDDEGFGHVCEQFPNLEFIKLWHSQSITDASAEHLKKLSQLTGIEISAKNASAALLKPLIQLPIDHAGLGYGVNTPASDAIATVRSIPTLRRLSIEASSFRDADLTMLATVKQLEKLSIERLPLTGERVARLKDFAHLKELELAERRKDHWYSDAIKAKVPAVLPNVTVRFVQ